MLNLFVASWRRQFSHRQWSVDDIVGATAVLPAVHVDHPDSDRCHWHLPRLLPRSRWAPSVPGTTLKLPDGKPLPTPLAGQVCREPLPACACCCPWCGQPAPCAHSQCMCARSWPAPCRACGWRRPGGSRFNAQVLLFAPHGCGSDASGLWLLVAPCGARSNSFRPSGDMAGHQPTRVFTR